MADESRRWPFRPRNPVFVDLEADLHQLRQLAVSREVAAEKQKLEHEFLTRHFGLMFSHDQDPERKRIRRLAWA